MSTGTGIASCVSSDGTGDAFVRPSPGAVRVDQAAPVIAAWGQQASPAPGRLPVIGQARRRFFVPVAEQLDEGMGEEAREQCCRRHPGIIWSGQQVRVRHHDELPQGGDGPRTAGEECVPASAFLGPLWDTAHCLP